MKAMNPVLQPVLYKIIANKNPRDMEQLLADGVIDATFVKGLEQEYKSNLEVNLEESRKKGFNYHYTVYENEWKGFEQVSDAQMLKV
jgi:2-oxoglutarate dehydrogenase E1 component